MPVLVGKHAPEFTAKAVVNNQIIPAISLREYRGKYVVLFFYPLNFTFVCPTELHAFQERLTDFKEKNAELMACSIDSPYSHYAWLNTPKAKGGVQGITYPLISDINKNIARDYDVLSECQGITLRGLFLIDKEGIVRHQVVNDLPLGRSVDEVLRVLDALIYFEKHGEVCPANWQIGRTAFKPTQESLEKYFAKSSKENESKT